jgi:hypothetical protein
MVYFRPQYLKFRQRDPSDFRITSVLRVLNIKVPRFLTVEWWQSRDHDENKQITKHDENPLPISSTEKNNVELGDSESVNNSNLINLGRDTQ